MTRKISGQIVVFVSVAAFCLDFTNVAFAQQESKADQLQEIIITAQKRISTVQDAPVSITALTGQDLEDRGITDITSIVQSGIHENERSRPDGDRDARDDVFRR